MRAFACDVCGALLVFENSVCITCGTPQGFSVEAMRLVPVPGPVPVGSGGAGDAGAIVPCANLDLAACNWLARGGAGALCRSCALTRTRPGDGDGAGLAAFARAEAAKRRLVYQLLDLGLSIDGLAFDLLSSTEQVVVTGYLDGVVTIDLAEGHDPHREAMRVQMGEPYRTLLGHVRHEVGHFYWQVLVGEGDHPALERFRTLFGDEREDYRAALERHYGQGPPAEWVEAYVSAYATAHPWEDWAETFAHYLHIRDSLQTAAAYGMVVTGPQVTGVPGRELVALPRLDGKAYESVEAIVRTWLPLTYALNAVNRSMGRDDLYPFVLTQPVVDKLAGVHDLVTTAGSRAQPAVR